VCKSKQILYFCSRSSFGIGAFNQFAGAVNKYIKLLRLKLKKYSSRGGSTDVFELGCWPTCFLVVSIYFLLLLLLLWTADPPPLSLNHNIQIACWCKNSIHLFLFSFFLSILKCKNSLDLKSYSLSPRDSAVFCFGPCSLVFLILIL